MRYMHLSRLDSFCCNQGESIGKGTNRFCPRVSVSSARWLAIWMERNEAAVWSRICSTVWIIWRFYSSFASLAINSITNYEDGISSQHYVGSAMQNTVQMPEAGPSPSSQTPGCVQCSAKEGVAELWGAQHSQTQHKLEQPFSLIPPTTQLPRLVFNGVKGLLSPFTTPSLRLCNERVLGWAEERGPRHPLWSGRALAPSGTQWALSLVPGMRLLSDTHHVHRGHTGHGCVWWQIIMGTFTEVVTERNQSPLSAVLEMKSIPLHLLLC